ncbi:hypothetical protein C7401_102274 [Paraburkholderia unamae]|uniref:hypothetical protein n=1 Tax=Paraburkholderia unamae TaxID=219649 RepID=UPI000DC539AD|nr:hypothetical protein [Paraburkholderia unamae]RAR66849.1 hypothetical protein C7401_102274 [Paraburkholderia unamae]
MTTFNNTSRATNDERIEFRFIGHNTVVYGRGPTLIEAIRNAEGRIGETMFTQDDIDANGYVVEVEQRRDADNGEWIDVR